MRLFMKHSRDAVCDFRALKVQLFVGTSLGLIDHYDAIFYNGLTRTDIFQMCQTSAVPCMTATSGSAVQARHIELEGGLRGSRTGPEAEAKECIMEKGKKGEKKGKKKPEMMEGKT